MPIKVKIQGIYAMTPWGYFPCLGGKKKFAIFLRFCGANLRFFAICDAKKNATKMEALITSEGMRIDD